MSSRVLSTAVLVLALLCLPTELSNAALQSGARPGGVALELPEVLRQRPQDFPSAQPERWARFFDPAAQAEIGATLAPGVLDGMRIAESAYAQELFLVGLEALHSVLLVEPDFPPAWLVAGATYWRLRRYGDALYAYDRFLAVAPDQIARTHGRGHALYTLGRYLEAKEHYLAVLEHTDQSAQIRLGLALAELRLGESEAALKHLDQVLEGAPDDAEALAWRAQMLFDLGHTAEALEGARRAAQHSPGDPRPVWIAMEALFELGRDDEAQREEKRWRVLERSAADRRAIEGRLLLHPRQPHLARQLVENAVATKDVGLIGAALGRLRASTSPGESALSACVLAVETWLGLGAQDEARRAALDMERRCASEPAAWQRLAVYWAALGDLERAERAQQRYRDLGPP